jgi:tripartite ATP-independent transporter DctM subunit
MAQICFVSGFSKDLYNLAAKWLGHFPGGIAMATVGACASFAAISASSVATAATIGLVAIPEMKKYRYDPALATGCVAAGGSMGVLIPPSGILILYGVISETSIGKLFIAGIIPGVIEAVFYIIAIIILCMWKPHYGPRGPSSSFTEKVAAFGSCGEIFCLIALVLGGLIIGWFTPTEAGAVGAAGAILISLFRRRINWQKLWRAFTSTLKTTGMVFCILIGALIFKYFMAVTTIPFWLADFVTELPVPPLAIMGLIVLVYIFLGCIMDAAAMILLTIPIFLPTAINLGFDPIWFGVIIVAVTEIAMITPPIGMNVYVIAGVAPDVPLQTIFKGILPFLIADFCRLTLYLCVPAVVLFLPSIM